MYAPGIVGVIQQQSPAGAEEPSAPSGLDATAASTSQINLSWTDNSSDETGFKVYRSTSSGSGFSLIATTSANATSYSNTGLSQGTRYYYKVAGTNAEGDSADSNEANTFTLPGQVTGLSASATGTTIALSWNNPTGTETGYKVERSTSSGSGFSQIATPTSTSYSDTGLTAGVTYYYRVRAYNSGGNGAYSSEANDTTDAIPTAPSGLSVITHHTEFKNALSWTDNSSNETGFKVYTSADDSSYSLVTTTSANTTSYIHTGLSQGTRYYYKVSALGVSGESALTSSVNTFTLPGQVTGLSASSSPIVNSISLSWSNPSGTETGYKIERSTSSGSGFSQIATTASTSYADTSGDAGTTYYYKVRAYNSGGDGAYSSEVNATTLAVPAKVTGLSVTVSSTSQLSLSWSAVSGATSYKIERSTSSGSGFSQIASGVTSTSYNNTGLSQGTRYYYRVRATNGAGDGDYSTEANNFTLPGQVTGLSATAASSSQINLSWNNPSGTETGYKIERSTSSGSGFSQIATTASTSYSNTGLTASTTYYYKVRAYNSGGDGAYSSEVNATTQSSSGTAPTSVSIASSSSGNYNNACFVKSDQSVGGSHFPDFTPSSDSSSNSYEVDVELEADGFEEMINTNGIPVTFYVGGYLRATGATSYSWDLDNLNTEDFSTYDTVAFAGTANTDQDNTDVTTSGKGIEETVRLTFTAQGRGAFNTPSSGEILRLDLEGAATNSNGTTNAQTLQVNIEWAG